jgi:hypothetical protein
MRRPVYLLRLQPLPRVDPIRALRGALKTLLRQHGMRCLSLDKEVNNPKTPEPNQEDAHD